MSVGLNHVQTADDYITRATFQDGGVYSRVNIIVEDEPIFYQLNYVDADGGGPNMDAWLPERYLPAASGPFGVSLSRRCSGIRFRSAVVGAPAFVTAELIPKSELGM